MVAKVKAADADIGSNAEMDYRIMDSDGPGMFNITTDEDTQDGVITLLKVKHALIDTRATPRRHAHVYEASPPVCICTPFPSMTPWMLFFQGQKYTYFIVWGKN